MSGLIYVLIGLVFFWPPNISILQRINFIESAFICSYNYALRLDIGRLCWLILLCNTYLKFPIFPTQKQAQQLRSKEPGLSTILSILHKCFIPPFEQIKSLCSAVETLEA